MHIIGFKKNFAMKIYISLLLHHHLLSFIFASQAQYAVGAIANRNMLSGPGTLFCHPNPDYIEGSSLLFPTASLSIISKGASDVDYTEWIVLLPSLSPILPWDHHWITSIAERYTFATVALIALLHCRVSFLTSIKLRSVP